MGFPRQEYWRGDHFFLQGNLPDPRIQSASPALAGRLFTPELAGKPTPEPTDTQNSDDNYGDKTSPSLSGRGAGWGRAVGLAGGAASIQIRPPHPQLCSWAEQGNSEGTGRPN